MTSETAPIGVFDSGVGGLTVLRALRDTLPHENFLYLGDTARLPYGTKSPDTVRRYALGASRLLVDRGVKALVVACNTASAVALPALTAAFAPLPVFGVVEPGAESACGIHSEGGVLVLATESTVRGGAYARAILQRRPGYRVYSRPCPLLVAMAEEGRTADAIVELVVADYLRGLQADVHTLVLGCTHFPVFIDTFRRRLPAGVLLVDSASTTAKAVARALAAQDRLAPASAGGGALRLLATDGTARFRRIGGCFLGEPVMAPELVDL